MKMFKSLLSVILVLLLVFSFTGCLHKQNEIAVEVGDTKFTAAQYSYALLMADSEAQSRVSEQLQEEGADTSAAQIDFYAQKIDDVDYVTWVENRAIEMLSEYAAYAQLFDDAKLELDSETIANNKSYADYYYSYYQSVYEGNGISKETYTNMLTYDLYADRYFTHLYGAEGSKAIPAEDVKKTFDESYRIAFVLEVDTAEMEEDDIAEAKTKLEGYKTDLANGKNTVDIYNEYYGLNEETEKAGTGAPAKEEKEVVQVLVDPAFDEANGYGHWDDIKELAFGEAKIIEETDDDHKHLMLVYMVKIAEDDNSYLEELDGSIRWGLKSEEYEKDISAHAAGLTVVKNKYTISEFKVKEIYYGE